MAGSVELFALISVAVVMAQNSVTGAECGSPQTSFTIAGASSVSLLAEAWVSAYGTTCAQANVISIDSGGSSSGAARVCGTSSVDAPVDIGGMSRSFNSGEAISDDGWNYKCERSPREVIQVDVASEGISAAVNIRGIAADCLFEIGGISIDQLRWIYSNYNEVELSASGWDPQSVPNSDNNPLTHLWSELSFSCPDEEILIAGTEEAFSESFAFFSDLVFLGADETFDVGRPGSFLNSTDDSSLVAFILDNDAAIAYFGLSYILTDLNQDEVSLVSIQVSGDEYVKPSAVTFEDGTYPLSRRLFMNVYAESVDSVRHFIDFGYTSEGDEALKNAGFWPIDAWEKVVLATRLQAESGVPIVDVGNACGPVGGEVSIAGSSTVFPVAQIWASIYQIGCDIDFTVEGGGSSNGAGRVCGNEARGIPVDIGDMSREWQPSEATQDDFLYSCLEPGDTERSAIQIDVAIDGLTVAVQEGSAAWECIQILGGLTIDQLRWIYSNYNDFKLEETGWDPSSLSNSDHNSQTHLWSELNSGCQRIEIRIAGADDQSGTYEYFLETVLTDHGNGETFDLARPGFGYENSEDDEVLVAYLQEFGGAISYFGYSYYYAFRNTLSAVAIQNEAGEYVFPSAETVSNGEYNPLARRIYMNLLNDRESLENTVPFVKFGLRHPELVATTGYVAIPDAEIEEMIARMENGPYDGSNENGGGLSTGAIVGIAIGSTIGFCCILAVALSRSFCQQPPEK